MREFYNLIVLNYEIPSYIYLIQVQGLVLTKALAFISKKDIHINVKFTYKK